MRGMRLGAYGAIPRWRALLPMRQNTMISSEELHTDAPSNGTHYTRISQMQCPIVCLKVYQNTRNMCKQVFGDALIEKSMWLPRLIG